MSAAAHQPRLWLIFFLDCHPGWWARFLRPGFRHVCAASWYGDQERWVYVNASRMGTTIEVLRGDEFGPRFQVLMTTSTAILRMASARERRRTPATFHCVGAIKALLGVRCCALTPHALFRALQRLGAEEVARAHEQLVRKFHDPTLGGPLDPPGAGAPAGDRGVGADPLAAGPASP